jgi:1,2-diacylglycerol 3-alpha-glucosyltransferase
MTIFQFTNTHPAETDPDSLSITACARALVDAGHHVVVVAPSDDYPRQPGRPARLASTHLQPALAAYPATSSRPPGFPAPADLIPPPLPLPDLIHAQHPFLAGEEALHRADRHSVPLLFTARLRYESPRHLPSVEAANLKSFVERLGVCFANRCDLVIAPTPALAVRLFEGGVMRPIHVVPDTPDPETSARRAGHLLELYAEAIKTRSARGPLLDTPPLLRLQTELARAWAKIHPFAPSRATRSAAALAQLRDGTALTC